jgi:hypothetical protein
MVDNEWEKCCGKDSRAGIDEYQDGAVVEKRAGADERLLAGMQLPLRRNDLSQG